MAEHSMIEWTDATWNPVTGCSVVSPGCAHCYAMRLAGTRLQHHPSRAGLTRASKAGPVWTGEVRLNETWLGQPLGWRRPRRIFVCAHGDLFHEAVPDEWIDRVFAVMALAPQHQFQVLTKRSARMQEYLTAPVRGPWAGRMHSVDAAGRQTDFTDARRRIEGAVVAWLPSVPPAQLNLAAETQSRRGDGFMPCWPLPNVWLGVSVEEQRRADERVPDLLATPAAIRFVSAEPLLGPVDLSKIGRVVTDDASGLSEKWGDALRGVTVEWNYRHHRGDDGPRLAKLDWVICGGESGDGARPMHPDWARELRDQCAAAGVPFFFKQWGEWAPGSAYGEDDWLWIADGVDGKRVESVVRLGKARAGRLLDGVAHDAMPALAAP